jgi:hypothetical protein
MAIGFGIKCVEVTGAIANAPSIEQAGSTTGADKEWGAIFLESLELATVRIGSLRL